MKTLRLCIPLFTALFLTLLAMVRTDRFSLQKIGAPLLQESDLPDRIDFAWPLSFRYLDRGRQCFAFESLDGKYVLKFFDRTQFDASWRPLRPATYFAKKKRRLIDRARIYPESYRIALAQLPEETGLLAVHQGPSTTKYPNVEVVDKASRRWLINLNEVPFVLQRKGSYKLLSGKEPLETVVEQFLAFQAKRIGLGIADADRDIKRNYAWHEGHLLYIDPARFALEEGLRQPDRLNREWWGVTYRLRKWIVKNAPDKLDFFDACVAKYKNLSVHSMHPLEPLKLSFQPIYGPYDRWHELALTL